MSIRVKQLLIRSLLLLSFGVLFWYSWKSKEFNEQILEETQFNEQLYVELLQIRRAEKDFFARYKRDLLTAEKYLDKHKNLCESYRAKIQHLEFSEKKDCEFLLDKYEKTFNQLSSLTLLVGSETEGMHLELNEALRTINWESEQKRKLVNSIKLFEANYLISKKEIYKDNLKKHINQLLALNLNNEQKQEVIEYNNVFHDYSDLINQIGYNEDVGLRGEMREKAHMMEDKIQSIKALVSSNINTKIRAFEMQMVIVLIVGVALFSLSFFYITSQVFKKIQRLSEKVKNTDLNNIVVKDYKAEIPTTKDELDWLDYQYNKSVLALNKSFNEKIKLQTETDSAKNALEFRKQFLAKMAHELRTPLNGIIGITEHIQTSKMLNSENQKHFDHLAESADNLLTIVNDTLDLSKLEEGKMNLHPTNVSIEKLLKDVIKLYRTKANEKNLTLGYTIAPDIPQFIHVDPIRLSQIINNLVSNAIKFTFEGGIQIHVTPSSIYGKSFILNFSIIDTGKGIPPERIPNIFNEYEQLEEEDKSSEGTGLGLPICRELCELMGGKITVSSTLGKGSKFSFTVPTSLAEEELNSTTQEDKLDIPLLLNILLVDDQPTNRVVAKLMLEKMGCSITEAKDGLDALNKAKSLNFDLILMDVNMPIMNGFEATQKIKHEIKPTPPIIGLSANVMEGDIQHAIEMGMDDYIGKPFKFNTLKSVILRHKKAEIPVKIEM